MGYPLSISQAFPFHTLHTASDQRLEVGNILGVWLPRSTSLAQWWNTNKQESTELCLLQDQSSPHSLSEHNTELTFMHPNKPAGYRGSSVGNSRIQRVVSGQAKLHSYKLLPPFKATFTFFLHSPKQEIPLNKQVD